MNNQPHFRHTLIQNSLYYKLPTLHIHFLLKSSESNTFPFKTPNDLHRASFPTSPLRIFRPPSWWRKTPSMTTFPHSGDVFEVVKNHGPFATNVPWFDSCEAHLADYLSGGHHDVAARHRSWRAPPSCRIVEIAVFQFVFRSGGDRSIWNVTVRRNLNFIAIYDDRLDAFVDVFFFFFRMKWLMKAAFVCELCFVFVLGWEIIGFYIMWWLKFVE